MFKNSFILIFMILWAVLGTSISQENQFAKTNDSEKLSQAEKFFELSKSYLAALESDKAIYYAEKAIQLNSNVSEYYRYLALAYGQKAQKVFILSKFSYAKKCLNAFKKAVAIDGRNTKARRDLMNYYLSAPGIAGGDNEKAEEQAKKIIEIDPIYGHQVIAEVFEAKGNFSRAEVEYKTFLELNPYEANSYLYLGYFYQRGEAHDKASKIFEEAIKYFPQEMIFYYQLGKSLLLWGQKLEKAITCLQKYLEKEPDSESPTWADAHWRMGMIYEKMGNKEQAISEYEKALELDSKHKQAREALKRLRG